MPNSRDHCPWCDSPLPDCPGRICVVLPDDSKGQIICAHEFHDATPAPPADTPESIPSGLQKFTVYLRQEDGSYLDPKGNNVFADVRINPGEEWPQFIEVVPATRLAEAEQALATERELLDDLRHAYNAAEAEAATERQRREAAEKRAND